jgi:D-3-phosphoglycerate dehydrogenase
MNKVLIGSRSFGKYSSAGLKILEENGFVVKKLELGPLVEEKLIQILAQEEPQVYICGAEHLSEKVLLTTKELKLIVKHGVGVDNIDLDVATRLGIAVANMPSTNTDSVADFTVMLILALVRKLYRAVCSTKSGGWEAFIGNEIRSIVVGLVGTGKIGKEVAKRLYSFGAQIIAYDLVEDSVFREHYNIRYVALEELLRNADIISLHLPLTPQTRHIISYKELSLMKRTAYIVNTARGELIDETALYQVLKSNLIAGAALDVYAKEPPYGSPLLLLDNVIATPHIAAYTVEAMERMDTKCADTIVSFFAGKVPESLLNPSFRNAHYK